MQELRLLSKTPLAGRSLQQTNRMMELLKLRDAASSSSSKRKRKKRRKKKTPRASSHPSLRRAHRRQRQWYVLAGFAGYDTPRAVFPSIINARGDSTGAVLGQSDMPVVVPSGAFGQTEQKTVDFPQLQLLDKVYMSVACCVWCLWPDVAENCGDSVVAVRGISTTLCI